jgi:hypothetical protein
MAPAAVGAEETSGEHHAAATARAGRGYWMLGIDGQVWAFGEAAHLGQPADDYDDYPDCSSSQLEGYGFCDHAVDLEPTPTGEGYWVLDTVGFVWAFGDAPSPAPWGWPTACPRWG